MAATAPDPEGTLAAWAADLAWADVPARVQDRVGDLLVDALASAFVGRDRELVERVVPVAAAYGGDGDASRIGGGTSSPAGACLLNAYAITAATACDVYRPGLCHVTPVVLPPLLSLARDPGVTSDAFLAALAVGAEVTVRLCRELGDEHFCTGGWHAPGVAGAVGAAAAAARILQLDVGRTGNALAHGAAQATGTFAGLGTEAVKFNQAHGAIAGLLAGLIAAEGHAASPRWLTRPGSGMLAVQGDGVARGELTSGLGSTWMLEEISLRRWPAASSVQSLIECALELVDVHAVLLDDVEHVDIALAPEAFAVSGRHEWGDPLSAQQSAAWVLAVTLADGAWWLEQCSPTRITDADLGELARRRVTVTADPKLAIAAVQVSVRLRDGRQVRVERADAPGDPTRPLARAALETKLHRAADHTLSEARVDELAYLLREPARPSLIADLLRLACSGPGR